MSTSVPGFLASGISSGIKTNKTRDLGLLYSEKPATTVGVYTTNKIKAAPVIVTQDKLKNGMAQAIIVNSGNANAGTGAVSVSVSICMYSRCNSVLCHLNGSKVHRHCTRIGINGSQ